MLDELLAPIPSNQRTNTVINKIHTMIERYEQLRESFSIFNKEGLAVTPKKKGFEYKPLAEALFSLDKSLHWILPVVRNRKKTYNVDPLTVTASEDIIPYNLGEKLDEEGEIYQQYLSGDVPDDQNKYNSAQTITTLKDKLQTNERKNLDEITKLTNEVKLLKEQKKALKDDIKERSATVLDLQRELQKTTNKMKNIDTSKTKYNTETDKTSNDLKKAEQLNDTIIERLKLSERDV